MSAPGIWTRPPRAFLLLAAITLGFRIATALPIERAGYMDASYTLHVAENLAVGRGFNEDVLWNYLDSPSALPHPSNLYWMPLPAILAAAAIIIFGTSFHAAQIPFVLLSVFPPLFAFYLSAKIFRRDDYAWIAGLLTAFSGFYTIYWISPDNFTPFAVTADLALLWLAFGLEWRRPRDFFIAGIFVGLSQLSRADGFMLLVIVPFVLFFSARPRIADTAYLTLVCAVGFMLVLTPWLVRNYFAVGSFFAPGGARTLFLTGYDELFRFNTANLTLSHYLDWGVSNIVASKLTAFGFDLLVLLFGALQLFLAPCAVLGLWDLRTRVEFKPMLIYLALLIVAMPLVFTFPSVRGSMLHSSAALVAYFAVGVPPGLSALIEWIARHRRAWDASSARRFFGAGFVALSFILSVFLYTQGVFGDLFGGASTIPLWNARDGEYAQVARELAARGVSPSQPVMTVDPPSFRNDTGRRSIYLPTESVDAIFQAAKQFDVHYLVLQYDHPRPLADLYSGNTRIDGLVPVAQVRDPLGRPVTLFEIER